MCGCGGVLRAVLCLEFDRVDIGLRGVEVAFGVDEVASAILDGSVCLQHVELGSWEHLNVGVHELLRGVVEPLNDPALELLVFARCRRRKAGNRLDAVEVERVVFGFVRSAVGVVHDADAVRSRNGLAPLALQLNLLHDVRTIGVSIGRCAITPLVHGICIVGGVALVVGKGDAVVYDEHFLVEERPVRQEPADELKIMSGSCRYADRTAVRDLEVHLLGVGTPI